MFLPKTHDNNSSTNKIPFLTLSLSPWAKKDYCNCNKNTDKIVDKLWETKRRRRINLSESFSFSNLSFFVVVVFVAVDFVFELPRGRKVQFVAK